MPQMRRSHASTAPHKSSTADARGHRSDQPPIALSPTIREIAKANTTRHGYDQRQMVQQKGGGEAFRSCSRAGADSKTTRAPDYENARRLFSNER